MTIYTNLTIILPKAAQALAQGLCVAAAGEAGSGMFTTGLNATGKGEATHYISTGAVEDTFADMLPLTTIEMVGEEAVVTKTAGNLAAVLAIVEASGTGVPESTITNLFAQLDVSEQPPFTAMARLGLQIISE